MKQKTLHTWLTMYSKDNAVARAVLKVISKIYRDDKGN